MKPRTIPTPTASRIAFFTRMRQVSERANLAPEEADQLADEAVRAVRSSLKESDR